MLSCQTFVPLRPVPKHIAVTHCGAKRQRFSHMFVSWFPQSYISLPAFLSVSLFWVKPFPWAVISIASLSFYLSDSHFFSAPFLDFKSLLKSSHNEGKEWDLLLIITWYPWASSLTSDLKMLHGNPIKHHKLACTHLASNNLQLLRTGTVICAFIYVCNGLLRLFVSRLVKGHLVPHAWMYYASSTKWLQMHH